MSLKVDRVVIKENLQVKVSGYVHIEFRRGPSSLLINVTIYGTSQGDFATLF